MTESEVLKIALHVDDGFQCTMCGTSESGDYEVLVAEDPILLKAGFRLFQEVSAAVCKRCSQRREEEVAAAVTDRIMRVSAHLRQ